MVKSGKRTPSVPSVRYTQKGTATGAGTVKTLCFEVIRKGKCEVVKYHRWIETDGIVTCDNCGISISANVKPRRVTRCPPTWFESSIIAKINYGSTINEDRDFNGLLALCESIKL